MVLYRPNSEHGRAVETFVRDFQYAHTSLAERLELQTIDSREGMAQASLYDIMSYPAIMVLADDGSLVKDWSGSLPLIDEVANYAHSVSGSLR